MSMPCKDKINLAEQIKRRNFTPRAKSDAKSSYSGSPSRPQQEIVFGVHHTTQFVFGLTTRLLL